ncbi:hypothetical protein GCM10007907_12920 [Chitinimonas prasina]|uniref:DUF4393 domain-containing protein n=1 Tax=Chitinimonas prasina TaxID=1434937 RepID=A0ABQ5YDI2_9NEIS|nr:hypothetical protein [Chitinimonas prasina]GLR12502.1 hypothetical protein GCM10007907_12920 [Chitinimonas prasina]
MTITPNTPKNLQSDSTDYVTAAAKGVLGMVPFAGSLLAELAGTVIPNQRIDRLAKFAIELESRLSRLDHGHLSEQLSNENFTDLAEESIRQAAKSISDERRLYLSALLVNGISSTLVSHTESKHLLQILGELNDIEVVWLRYYLNPTVGSDAEFIGAHKEILKPITPYLGGGQDLVDKHALQESYKEHLVRLGLLVTKYELDPKTKQPIFDTQTGRQKVRGYQITSLGRLLLRQIDLVTNDRA